MALRSVRSLFSKTLAAVALLGLLPAPAGAAIIHSLTAHSAGSMMRRRARMAVLSPGNEHAELFQLPGDGKLGRRQVLSNDVRTPLGSVWKLFVYSYLVEKGVEPEPYTCKGRSPEEMFCCKPGGSIGREDALAKSCGLYFDPARLGISQQSWSKFWRRKGFRAPPWLFKLKDLEPSRRVRVRGLLSALLGLRKHLSRQGDIALSLTQTLISGTAEGSVRYFGSSLQVKTWTWRDSKEAAFQGGFAGWLQDGSAIWFSGEGAGASQIQRYRREIEQIGLRHSQGNSNECVRVDFFARHPLREVLKGGTREQASAGAMQGDYFLRFANGVNLPFHAGTGIRLEVVRGKPRIWGEFSMTEYVARVLQREARPAPVEAARAMSIAIRSFLRQNGRRDGKGCWRIADSTHAQRVSPEAASESALSIASWTRGLILKGVPRLRYRSDRKGARFSWQQARSMAKSGFFFDEILKSGYPSGRLAVTTGESGARCQRLRNAENWLSLQLPRWKRRLMTEEGFESPVHPEICQARTDQPSSYFGEDKIFLPSFENGEDQLTLAHEYLHLAFAHHPRGQDEKFIETTARRLLQILPEESP